MLKRLELVGFKSFSQKTVLDFPKGITVIVGPNGSGKSNIIDALRWILGEREAKNLRGLKADHLIFSGTSKKARLGMAQATLYFDNQSKALPVDFIDVAISRRIYRDGTSECLLNKSQVRLKDLVDLFAQSKMGTKGFSIINQGNSDLFVRASASERREMMEEILGLRQYQIKKRDAELKLINTQVNLDKVTTTVEELLPRLRLLRRQTGKWEKRAIYEKELKELEDKYFSIKIKDLEKSSQTLEPAIKDIDRQLNEKIKDLHELEEEVKKIESQKPPTAQTDGKKVELQKEFGRLETELKFVAPTGKNIITLDKLTVILKEVGSKIKDLYKKSDLSQIQASLRELDTKIESALSDKSESLEIAKEKIGEELEKVKKELAEIDREENKVLSYFEDFNKVFRSAFEAASKKKDQIQQLKNQKNKLFFEKDRWNYKWQDLEEKIRQIGRKVDEFKDLSLVVEDFDFEEAERRILKLRNDLALVGEVDLELVKEAGEVESRYQFLSSQTEDLGKASTDLSVLISDLGKKIHSDFNNALKLVNEEFTKYFTLMFGEGKARLVVADEGIEIEAYLPSKGIKSIDALSGGEKSLVAIAVLFALISISPPPFLVFDEVDAALDEKNSRRFVELLKKFVLKTQFVVVTHNRAVMEQADVLYGITMGQDGISKVLSLKLN